MVAARSASRGLSGEDLQSIRDTLAAGRKPKVMFTQSAGQIAGQVGQVVQLTDPDGSEEFIVVRFGRDELPFSPTDLTMPPKSAPARKTVPPRSADTMTGPAGPPPRAAQGEVAVPAPREEATMPRSTPSRPSASRAASAPEVEASPAPPADTAPPATTPPAPQTAPAATAAAEVKAEAKPAKRAAKAAKPKAPASLTVTLAYTEGEWTVAANAGSKALARPYVIKPAEALKMVGMLDVPGVHEAVEQIVESERAEAQQHADQLRAQLAEIEAKLAELSGLG